MKERCNHIQLSFQDVSDVHMCNPRPRFSHEKCILHNLQNLRNLLSLINEYGT